MWALKIKARERWNVYNSRTKKFKVKVYSYSQNYYEEKGKYFYVGSGIVVGPEKNKKAFFADFKKDPKVEVFEINDDYFTCIYSELKSAARAEIVKIAYNPRLIFPKPVITDEEGWEEWEIASPKRSDLEAFVYVVRKNPIECKLYYLKKQKITNVMVYTLLPKLSEKQRAVILLAVEQGYYGYPRGITLEKLAKIAKISLSTFQFHLAKAEAKLLPFVAKKL
ncbi:MAG: helix-turn-helix domain-containing protein [Candidatus Woesearchaeota archaeon]